MKSYPLKVGVVRGVWGVWKWTGLMTGLTSGPPTWGSVSEKRDTALCTVTHIHTSFHPSFHNRRFIPVHHWAVFATVPREVSHVEQ